MAKRSRYAKSGDPKLVALCQAIEANDAKAVRAAIAAGADPNGMEPPIVIGREKLTTDWPVLHKAVLEPKRVAVVRVLLAAGAKHSFATRNYTPLELAAKYADVATIEALLDAGAGVGSRISKTGLGGGTALNHAASRGSLPIARLLLERGTPVDGADAAGFTPLHNAVLGDHRALVELLAKHGASLEARTRYGKETPLFLCRSAAMAKVLLARGADPNAIDEQGKKASEAGYLEAARKMIAKVVDPAIAHKARPRGRDKQAASDQKQLRKNLRKA